MAGEQSHGFEVCARVLRVVRLFLGSHITWSDFFARHYDNSAMSVQSIESRLAIDVRGKVDGDIACHPVGLGSGKEIVSLDCHG